MRGHIAKKKGRYYVVVDAPPGEDGKRRRRWIPAGATEAEAEATLATTLGKVYGGTYVDPSRQTFGAFLADDWLPAVRVTLKASTAKLYDTLVDAYVVPSLGQVKLQRLTASDLNRFYAEMLEDGKRRGDGGLSPTSVRNVHRVIHRALRDAVRWDRVAKNVAAYADPPRVDRSERMTWDVDDLRTFLGAAGDDDLGPVWLMLATTGMRRGEALGLKWSDVDLDAGRVTIRRTLSYEGTTPTLTEPKTAKSRRLVTIPAETVAALKSQKARQAEVRLAVGRGYRDEGFVFTGPAGAPLNPTTVSRSFVRLVEGLGLPRLTVHGLRHTWATVALGSGVPAKVASEVLGHSSIAITLDTYSHALPAMQEAATQAVADRIFGSR